MKLSRIVLAGAMAAAGTLVSTGVAGASTEANGVCESSRPASTGAPA
jgi:hypothetical protein